MNVCRISRPDPLNRVARNTVFNRPEPMLPKSLLTHVSTARNLIPSAPCFSGWISTAVRIDSRCGATIWLRVSSVRTSFSGSISMTTNPGFGCYISKRVAGATSDVPQRSSTCRNFFRAPIPARSKGGPGKGEDFGRGRRSVSVCARFAPAKAKTRPAASRSRRLVSSPGAAVSIKWSRGMRTGAAGRGLDMPTTPCRPR